MKLADTSNNRRGKTMTLVTSLVLLLVLAAASANAKEQLSLSERFLTRLGIGFGKQEHDDGIAARNLSGVPPPTGESPTEAPPTAATPTGSPGCDILYDAWKTCASGNGCDCSLENPAGTMPGENCAAFGIWKERNEVCCVK